MKKHLRLVIALATFVTVVMVHPTSGQAPLPPAHGQNGDQTSPVGTRCPLEHSHELMPVLILSLGYFGIE